VQPSGICVDSPATAKHLSVEPSQTLI